MLASLSDADVAALLQKLLLIKTNIRNASGKRGATNGKLRQGLRHGYRHHRPVALLYRIWSAGPSLRTTLMLIVPALVASVGLFYYLMGGRYVSTDNRQCRRPEGWITPEVSGKVVRIAVVEGQLAPGDELFAIDPVPYRLAAEEARPKSPASGRIRQPQEHICQPRQADRAGAPERRRQSGVRPQDLAAENRISTPSDLDKSRMALAVAKGLLEQLQQQEATVRNQLLGDVGLAIEKYPQFVEATVALQRSETTPTPCCAPPSPARQRKSPAFRWGDFLPPVWRSSHHRYRQRLGGCQSQGDRSHLRAPRPACRHHGRHLPLARVARQGRGHQPRDRPNSPSSAAERRRQLDQDRAARAAQDRVRAGPGPAPAAARA